MLLYKGAKLFCRGIGDGDDKISAAKYFHVFRMTFYSVRTHRVRMRERDRVVKDGGHAHFSTPRIVNDSQGSIPINYFRQGKPGSDWKLGVNIFEKFNYSQALVLLPIQRQ